MESIARLSLELPFAPWSSKNWGWFRTFAEIWDGALTLLGRKAKAKGGSDALGLWDFADPALVFGFLVAVPRYLLSTALKAPALLVAVLAFFTLYALLPANLLGDVLVFLIEAVMLRVILSVLLRDRDLILARSIRQTASSARDPGTVVAVLGAAHCNGVKRHLESASMEESESAL
ncbi:unnamed protein product [Effrenium voratum]|nr:unnamed protein product [Effrenium voratum]